MTSPSAPSATRSAGPQRRRPGEFGSGRKFTPRRKVCAFCVDKIKTVDYKDLSRLRRFLSERGKIEPRRKTGTCAAHQRSLNIALKRARQLAMLPFTAEHIRVTGVLVREPGAPPFRGPRGPRPVEAPEGAEAPAEQQPAPADGTADGTATSVEAADVASAPVAATASTAQPEAQSIASTEPTASTEPE